MEYRTAPEAYAERLSGKLPVSQSQENLMLLSRGFRHTILELSLYAFINLAMEVELPKFLVSKMIINNLSRKCVENINDAFRNKYILL
jgi:hypothetical protein